MTTLLSLHNVHTSWHKLLKPAIAAIDPSYLTQLALSDHCLPAQANIFNAFSQPLTKTQFILFGESPYPRAQSAQGYAFWDAAVKELWSATGLATAVNRATSFRNLIKMMLLAEGALELGNTSQAAIAALDKSPYVETNDQLFDNFLACGFLLLNASLTLTQAGVQRDARAWRPFIAILLQQLAELRPDITLLLFGSIAKRIQALPAAKTLKQIIAEHPLNISFIINPTILEFFRPLHLLRKI